MSNNSSDCLIGANVLRVHDQAYFILYFILTPIYCLVGTFGEAVLLFAFNKQSRTEKAYMYQVLACSSKLLEIFTFALGIVSRKWWSGLEQKHAAVWYQKIYVFMWYAAHLAAPVCNAFITSSLLLSLCMAADRLFALSRPFRYKTSNHHRHHILAAVLCFSLGQLTSIFDCFRFNVIVEDQIYQIFVNSAYVASAPAITFSHLRNAVRIMGIFCLVALNIAMVTAFRKRSRKVAQMNNREQEAEATRLADKTLLLLTIWQSIIVATGLTPLTIYYVLAYLAPSFSSCWGLVMLLLVDSCHMLGNILDMIVTALVNRRTRWAVSAELRKMFDCRKEQSRVIALTRVKPS